MYIANGTKWWSIYHSRETDLGPNNKRYRELEDLLGKEDYYENIDPLPIGSDEYKNAAHEYAKMDPNPFYFANYIERGDFFKIREVSISYNLKDLLFKIYNSPVVSDLVVGLSARNLWTTTKYSGADVEINTGGSKSKSRRVDYRTLMHPRVYNIWFRVSL